MYHCRSFMQHVQKASSRRDPNGSPALIARAVLYSALLLLHLHEKARESCWKVARANQFGEIEGGISGKLHMPCTQCRSSCVYIRAPTVARCLKSERQGCCPEQIFKLFFFLKSPEWVFFLTNCWQFCNSGHYERQHKSHTCVSKLRVQNNLIPWSQCKELFRIQKETNLSVSFT